MDKVQRGLPETVALLQFCLRLHIGLPLALTAAHTVMVLPSNRITLGPLIYSF